jgi:hypothetical protein
MPDWLENTRDAKMEREHLDQPRSGCGCLLQSGSRRRGAYGVTEDT